MCLLTRPRVSARVPYHFVPRLTNPELANPLCKQSLHDALRIKVRYQNNEIQLVGRCHPRMPVAKRVPRSDSRCQSLRLG